MLFGGGGRGRYWGKNRNLRMWSFWGEGTTPRNAQRILPDSALKNYSLQAWRTIWKPGIESRSDSHKANALPTDLSFWLIWRILTEVLGMRKQLQVYNNNIQKYSNHMSYDTSIKCWSRKSNPIWYFRWDHYKIPSRKVSVIFVTNHQSFSFSSHF